MDIDRARAIAERLHTGESDEMGRAVLAHVRRVVTAAPDEARAVAWLHEVLECTAVPEQELLEQGLTMDELRALRLLRRAGDPHSDRAYLAHVQLIARAAGVSGSLARMVKVADLEDRRRHPRVRADGWAPPYDHGLLLLRAAHAAHGGAVIADAG